MKLVRRYSFEASHQLVGLPEGHPCTRLHGHGYRFEVTVEGEPDLRRMVIEYAELDAIVNKVLDVYDHHHLNDLFDQPTVEAIAADIWERLQPHATSVRVWETERSSVIYP